MTKLKKNMRKKVFYKLFKIKMKLYYYLNNKS